MFLACSRALIYNLPFLQDFLPRDSKDTKYWQQKINELEENYSLLICMAFFALSLVSRIRRIPLSVLSVPSDMTCVRNLLKIKQNISIFSAGYH